MYSKMTKEELIEKVHDLENDVEALEEERRTVETDNIELKREIREIKDMAYDIYKF